MDYAPWFSDEEQELLEEISRRACTQVSDCIRQMPLEKLLRILDGSPETISVEIRWVRDQ